MKILPKARQSVEKALWAFSTERNMRKGFLNSAEFRNPFLLPRCAASLRTGHLRGKRDFSDAHVAGKMSKLSFLTN